MSVDDVVYTLGHLQEISFTIAEEDEASILEFQNIFYGGLDRQSIVEISTGLDALAHRIMLYLGKAMEINFSFKEHNQVRKMARKIKDKFSEAAVGGFFADGFKHMETIQDRYHALASGKSQSKEHEAKSDFDFWLERAQEDFETFWVHFDTWFQNDLYITQYDWERRQKHGVLADLFAQQSSIEDLEQGIEDLKSEDLEMISAKSIRDYVHVLQEDGEFQKAEFLLWKFEEKFSRTHEDIFKLHQLRAHLKLSQKEYAQALQEFEIALSKAEIYGEWDRRYTSIVSEILILKTRLNIAHDEEVLAKFEEQAKNFSDDSLLEWCKFSFIHQYQTSNINTADGLKSFIGDVLLDFNTFSLSPRSRIHLLQWVDDYLVETEQTKIHAPGARKTILNMIVDIAGEYSRWSVLSEAYSSLIEIAENDGENLFSLRELKNKQTIVDNELEILEEMYNTGEVATKQKNAKGIQSLKSYHEHCVQQGHTEAVEHLSGLNYWLSRTNTYVKLDDYNGPFYTLIRIINIMQSGKFRHSRTKRDFNFITFRENVLQKASVAGTPWAEAIALDGIMKTGKWNHSYSDAQRLSDLDRIIELETQMGAKKLCTLFKQEKAELLEKIDESAKSLELYEEVISEFMEIEPLSAFFTYSRMVKRQNLWVTKPDDVIQRCEIIKARLDGNNYDRMEFDSLQALAMVCRSTDGDLIDAKNHLQESFEIVISKPYVNDKNYPKYGGVISTYLLIDILENDEISQVVLDEIEDNSQFSSLYCLFWSGIELRRLAHIEAFNVIDKIERIADYLYDHEWTHHSLTLLNHISKHHHKSGNNAEADRFRKKIIMRSLDHSEWRHLGRAVRFYENTEEFAQSIEENDLLQKLQSIEPSQEKIILFITLGRRLGRNGLPYFLEALHSAEEMNDKGKISVILYRIARLTGERDDLVRIVEYLTENAIKWKTKFEPGIVGRVLHLLGKHPDRIIPLNQASVLIRLYLETVKLNLIVLDDYSLKQLAKVHWIMTKYGETEPTWRRSIVEMFQAFATQPPDAKNPIIAMNLVKTAEQHVNLSITHMIDEDTWKHIHSDMGFWLDAILNIEQLTPGVYHRKLYNDVWEAIQSVHELNKQEGEILCKVLVNQLRENEDKLNSRATLESKVQRAEAYMTLGDHTNVWQLLNDIGDWLAVQNHSFSRPSTMLRLLLIYSKAFNLESEERPELMEAMFKTIGSRAYRSHQKKEQRIKKTLVNIVEQNIEQFSSALSPFMPTGLEEIVIQVSEEQRKNKFEAENVLKKFVSEKAQNKMMAEAIGFHFKNKSAPNFITNVIALSADMMPTKKKRHDVLVSFFETTYAWNKGEGKTKADVLRWEKIEDNLNAAIVECVETDDSLNETDRKTLLVLQATRAFNIPRLRKTAVNFLIDSICSEDPKHVYLPRDEAYLQWIIKIFRTNNQVFKQLRVELTLNFERLILLNRYAKLAHSKGYVSLPKKLYHDVLTSPDCSQKMEAYTYYRLACLEDDYDLGKQSLMALIADKVNENEKAWVNRLLLSMYIIKHEGITNGVEAITKLALKSSKVRIVVEKEMEITEDGDITLDGEIQKCSQAMRDILTTKNNKSVKHYKSGAGNGNDIAYLSLDEDDAITKITVLQNKPHIEATQRK